VEEEVAEDIQVGLIGEETACARDDERKAESCHLAILCDVEIADAVQVGFERHDRNSLLASSFSTNLS